LSELQIDTIRTIATGETKARHFAQAILYARGEDLLDIPIETTIIEEDPEESRRSDVLDTNSTMLSIIPNPSDGAARIQWNLEESFSSATLIINDIRGIKIKSFTIENIKGEFFLNSLDLPSGIYVVKLKSTDREVISKLLIVR
jgi:hypothetical protein